MGVREWANEHPSVVYGAMGFLVLASLGLVVAELRGDKQPAPGAIPSHYYSVDDGQSFFVFGAENIAPFDYKGKTAVRAHVFEAGGKRFVGYLERYIPEARKAKIARTITPFQEMDGRELKRPGAAAWAATTDRSVLAKMAEVVSPSGSTETPVPVEP